MEDFLQKYKGAGKMLFISSTHVPWAVLALVSLSQHFCLTGEGKTHFVVRWLIHCGHSLLLTHVNYWHLITERVATALNLLSPSSYFFLPTPSLLQRLKTIYIYKKTTQRLEGSRFLNFRSANTAGNKLFTCLPPPLLLIEEH